MFLESFEKSTKSDQGCPRVCQNRSKGVPPEVPKTNRKQMSPPEKILMQFASKCDPHFEKNVVLIIIFYDADPQCFGDGFLMNCQMVLGSTLRLLFYMICWYIFEYHFETG